MRDFKEIWKEIPTSWKVAFFICMSATIGLLIWGFITPPPGEINDSILKGCFIISIYPFLFTLFICVLRGLNVHYDIKDGKITVSSKKKDNDETASEENHES